MKIEKHKILCDIIDGAYFNKLDNLDLVLISRTALCNIDIIDEEELKWCNSYIEIIKLMLYEIMTKYYDYYDKKEKELNNNE